MRQIRQQYGNDVRLVWKDAPLPFHDRAMPAAVAGREVFAQGGNAKFWAYHDLMYQNQQTFPHHHQTDGVVNNLLGEHKQMLGMNMKQLYMLMHKDDPRRFVYQNQLL